MDRITIKSCLGLSGICLALALGGCITIPNSPTPRFYMLQSVNEDQVSKRINIAPDMVISIGPVKIPEYLNRPQIVTRTKEKMLKFAEFDRWGESLDHGLVRLIREDLIAMLPGEKLISYPWDSSVAVKYQVTVEVIQLDSDLDRDMFFVVQWMVKDVQNSKTVIIKRSEFRAAIVPQDYSGLVKTLSTLCATLSSQIAGSLVGLKT